MSWQETEFQNLYLIPSKNGLTRPSKVRGSGYKFINMGELFSNDRIGNIEMERVQMSDKELENMLVQQGDLLFARQSLVLAGAGKCSIVQEVDEPTTFESHLLRVRLDKKIANPCFFYYYFRSPICKIKSIVTQGVQAGIRGNDLKKLSVHVPPLEIQNKIADILSRYDETIANNRRRIELLERSSRLLYREWFVYLRFPGHEHGAIDPDGIPEGWEKIPLGDVLTLQRGFDLPVAKRIEGNYPIYASTGINGYHEKLKVKAPGVVTGRSGSLGTVLYASEDFWPLNTTLWVKEFKKVDPIFAVYLLRNLHLEQYNGGAAVPTLNRNDVHRINVLCPSKRLLDLFHEFSSPIYEQNEKLNISNKKLQAARDLLLPRLMNGEINV